MEQAALKVAWVDFVESMAQWTHFVTVTCRPPTEREWVRGYNQRGASYLWKVWGRVVGRQTGEPVWFAVEELHSSGASHLHGLLQCDGAAKEIEAACVEEAGWSRVRDYVARAGAESYVTKYVLKGAREVRWSDGLGKLQTEAKAGRKIRGISSAWRPNGEGDQTGRLERRGDERGVRRSDFRAWGRPGGQGGASW